jgi:hypothetical protein
MHFNRFAVLTTLLMLAVVTISLAQMETATLSGKVTDQKGGIVAGAQLIVTNVGTNVSLRGATNQLGLYVIGSLPPGEYRVSVSKDGFKTINLSDLVLTVQDMVSRNFELQVGSVSESVTVLADVADVRTSPAVSTVVDQKLVGELPLNGRSFQTLFQLTPGVVTTVSNGLDQGQFSVNGQRANANYLMIDGASGNVGVASGSNLGQGSGGSVPAYNAFGGTNSLVSTDGVQEFAIQTSSYAPEFGRSPGAQISVVTKSGTNQFHGDAFDYVRNDIFDANDWFANHEGLKRSALRQNDFGGVLGGPVWRNKTFFFLSYEGLRLRQPLTGQSDVPTLAARSSAPSAMQPFLNAFPLPTGADEGNGLAPGNYGFSNPSGLDAISARVDHHFSQSLSIFGRYAYAPSDTKTRGGSHSLNTITDSVFGLHTVTTGLSYIIKPTITDDLRFNWSRSAATSSLSLDNLGGSTPLSVQSVVPTPFTKQNAAFGFDIFSGLNTFLELGRNSHNVQQQLNIVDGLSIETGSHLLKFGIDYRRLSPSLNPSLYVQEPLFSDVASVLAMTPLETVVEAKVAVKAEYTNYSFWGQDTWKPFSRFTLTYGLRWDFNPAPSGHGSNGLPAAAVANANNLSALSLAPAGTPLYHATAGNIAPRFGFAYQLRRSSKSESIVRGGFGMFYDLGNGPTGDAFAFFPFQAQNLFFTFPLTASEAAPPAINANPPFSSPVTAFPKTLKLPYTYQWNLSVEQSLGVSQTITLGYVGAIGKGLLRTTILTPPAVPSDFAQVNLVDNSGFSNYHALQAQFRRRAAQGLDVLASYTLAHSLDNDSSDVGSLSALPGQFLNPRADYGPSDFDIRHTMSAGLDYEISGHKGPGIANHLVRGWALDTVITARSSPPVNVTAFEDLGFGFYSVRPDLVPGAALYSNSSDVPGGRAINSTAFAVPAGLQGDLHRNFFRGFPLVQADLAVRRRFRLSERFSLQARLESFNLVNHPNFAPQSGSLGVMAGGQLFLQNGFGISRSMLNQGLTVGSFGSGFSPLYQIGGPRSLQIAVKLEF